MDSDANNHVITPGPYRATKLWNEVTKLFRAGMPLKKHRQHFRVYGNCFTAAAAADWLHELLRNNKNFGPEVTRQQTVQLLKKFLKNHVVEDVKGRWGTEEFEDNAQLYRFPSTSPLKPIPNGPVILRKKSGTPKDKEGFFKFRNSKKFDKETLENFDPESQELSAKSAPRETVHRREVTEEDTQEVWRNITLTHLQKILGLSTLEGVLDLSQVNVEHIVYNMTHVNKHGVVNLEDKTDDLPHWVLSAMKCLANWPKYDSSQPSYPGFEKDVFKTISDYFCSLPEPLLTFQYYDLFVNVLAHRGKRKNPEAPRYPLPPKTPHLNDPAKFFKSTECLLLSLVRKDCRGEDEGDECEDDSPMREVFSSRVELRAKTLRGGCAGKVQAARRASTGEVIGGSCIDLPGSTTTTTTMAAPAASRRRPQSFCLDQTVAEMNSMAGQRHSQRTLFRSEDNLLQTSSRNDTASRFTGLGHKESTYTPPDAGVQLLRVGHRVCASMGSLSHHSSSGSESGSPPTDTDSSSEYSFHTARTSRSSTSTHSSSSSSSSSSSASVSGRPFARPARPRSMGNLVDISEHGEELSASYLSINAPVAEITVRPDFSSTVDLRGPGLSRTTTAIVGGSSLDVRRDQGMMMSRRCQSSVDLFRPGVSAATGAGRAYGGFRATRTAGAVSATTATAAAVSATSNVSSVSTHTRRTTPDQTLLQPQLERVAIEALQLCTLLLPPASRRKLQLLMRMVSRMSMNVDMPRLHHAIGTRTLMVHTFSQCVLSCQEAEDLDELLASRLLSFLIDHHQEILQVPTYLHNAAQDHIAYLKKVQIMCPGIGPSLPSYSFCRQISTQEFEEQRLSVSQAAVAELLESIIKDKAMSTKEKKKKLKLFQKEYPDIYSRRFPTTESEAQLFADKPKIKPPMLIGIKKSKTFSIRN
ncbi:DEP domain-containing protein 1A isoform X2 [Engraulis encrasicolus]|uniref:DEP domain-containing protein 1A isoform X2 n=1 Tax=Engraulis encrasicolus TaxID=184585 RepID=UPI002FD519DC